MISFNANGNERLRITPYGDIGLSNPNSMNSLAIESGERSGLTIAPTEQTFNLYNRQLSEKIPSYLTSEVLKQEESSFDDLILSREYGLTLVGGVCGSGKTTIMKKICKLISKKEKVLFITEDVIFDIKVFKSRRERCINRFEIIRNETDIIEIEKRGKFKDIYNEKVTMIGNMRCCHNLIKNIEKKIDDGFKTLIIDYPIQFVENSDLLGLITKLKKYECNVFMVAQHRRDVNIGISQFSINKYFDLVLRSSVIDKMINIEVLKDRYGNNGMIFELRLI